MRRSGNSWKVILGLVISGVFLFLAFRKLDFHQMKQAFSEANYWWLVPSVAILFASHWLRSIRWQYLLNPVKKINVSSLFSALLIGYSVNAILPAHLGEVVRAYVIGRKRSVSVSSALATIVVERIVDVLCVVIIMAFSLVIYPFPGWVKKSGYIMFVFAVGLFVFLVAIKKYTEPTLKFIRFLLKPFPKRLNDSVENISRSFLDGLNTMNRKQDYIIFVVLSLLIWLCYWGVLYINFYTFNLMADYHLNVISGLVLLVITTISIVVPSSPGYVGTYHWLCQLSLELFGVPRAIGLTYAIVVHGINVFPVFIIGLILAWREGVRLSKVQKEKEFVEATIG